eukprot:TRINITY_DN20299_c0_g8_i2.p1 TRINITY_DN20299_c0_g8~~TRINITY_DN20299_c0_g8_i2.p1  ORF type:complete len:911 (+),score=297.47 TRINITY_DN20299_c0_g8_i2:46-2733(+)
MLRSLVGSEMCIRDRPKPGSKKKEKKAAEAKPAKEGPSKSEMKRLAKAAEKEAKKAAKKAEVAAAPAENVQPAKKVAAAPAARRTQAAPAVSFPVLFVPETAPSNERLSCVIALAATRTMACVRPCQPCFARVQTSEPGAKLHPSLWLSEKQALVGMESICWWAATNQADSPLVPPSSTHLISSWIEWNTVTPVGQKLAQLDLALQDATTPFLASTAVPTLADLLVWSSVFALQQEALPASVQQWSDRVSSECHATGIAAAAINCPRSAPEPEIVEEAPAAIRTQKFYLTTAINYTNGPPHMGHAYEGVTSDILSRYHRVAGRDVFFLTGTDEHGQKIAESAEKLGLQPIDICDKWAGQFQDLNANLEVSNDGYIRTTQPHHKENARNLFRKCKAAGDIYKGIYTGWYNVKEECYVTETDAQQADYKDTAGNPLRKMETECYFFKMSKYCDRLIAHFEANPDFLQPKERYNEILTRLKKDGLLDLNVSRPKSQLTWGIPIPDDDEHVMYVWFDALTNYLSGIDAPDGGPDSNARFWPAEVHIIGKDIIWFHSVIWPCMLMSANVPVAKAVFAHGFVNASDGIKMSKSIGNTVDPVDLLRKYDADTIRFFIGGSAVYGSDLPFSEENMIDLHNAHLADGIGNLVHRATNMIKSNCDGRIPDSQPSPVFNLKKLRVNLETAYKHYSIQDACMHSVEAVKSINKFITDTEPYKMKSNPVEQHKILRTICEAVYIVAHCLYPFVPVAMDAVFRRLNTEKRCLHELSPDFDNLKPGTAVLVGDILFSKLKKYCFVLEAPKTETTPDLLKDERFKQVFKSDVLSFCPGDETLAPADVRVELSENKEDAVNVVHVAKVMVVVDDGKANREEQELAEKIIGGFKGAKKKKLQLGGLEWNVTQV